MKENQLKLPNGKIITFNDEQSEGLKKIWHWLKNGDGTFFTLAGYAGTGKTTIIKKVLEEYRRGVVVSAPTHKAKKVIIGTTRKEGETMHALLGLRPDVMLDDFNPNDPKFNPIALPRITDYNFVVVDEASMINKELYELIINQTTKSNTKVLFMGDPAQIPPVGEKESIIFNQETNMFHQLTKIERQNDGNPLIDFYTPIRDNLLSLDGGIKRITNLNEKGEGIIFTVNKREFRKLMMEKFRSSEYEKDTDYIKVIAWKNETVMAANKVIRSELFGDDIDCVVVGDVLMAYRSVSDERGWKNIIENSADYKVVEKSGLETNQHGLSGYRVKLRENLNFGQFNFRDVFIVDVNDRANVHEYAQIHDFHKDNAKVNKKLWNKYYGFRKDNLLMTNIELYSNGTFREKWNIIAKDLDYGYAITGHKSQGSTYTHVFVMENDINDNWLMKERNQIKYVALTRPSISATVLTTKIDG